jgi:hypothetical protein
MGRVDEVKGRHVQNLDLLLRGVRVLRDNQDESGATIKMREVFGALDVRV